MSEINFIEVLNKEVIAKNEQEGFVYIKSKLKNIDGRVADVRTMISIELWKDVNIDKFILRSATDVKRFEEDKETE